MKKQAPYVDFEMVWFIKSKKKKQTANYLKNHSFQMLVQKKSSPNLIVTRFVKRKRADLQTFQIPI